jgi:hypothetical protein
MFVGVNRRFIAVTSLVLACASTAHADERADALAVEAARTLFVDGNADYQGGRWASALTALQRSYALVPSPNTMLMIARSLRELGRSAEAVDAFEKSALEAAQRVAKGDAKYSPTERAATEEGRKLRATLGKIRVRVMNHENVTATVDGHPLPLDASGTASVLHPAGSAIVVVRDASGAEQKQTVSVSAGSTVDMEFSGDAPPRAAVLPPPASTSATAVPLDRDATRSETNARSWSVPAAIGTGVLTLAGTAVFIGFGSASHATYERLSADCGPSSCGPSERDDADAAKRQQTIANVGVAAAGVALVATIAFVVVALTSPSHR